MRPQLLILAALLAGSASAIAHDAPAPIFVPDGVATDRRPIDPKSGADNLEWKGKVTIEGLPAHADPSLASPTAEALRFGQVYWIMAEREVPRRSLLLAVFEADPGLGRVVFRRHVGWVDANFVLTRKRPITVEEATKKFLDTLAKDDPRRVDLKRTLPLGQNPMLVNTLLKAITEPEKGRYAAQQLVEPALGVVPPGGKMLAPFMFYYVYDVIHLPGGKSFCLLSGRAGLSFIQSGLAVAEDALIGWRPMDSLMFWTNRQGLQPHTGPAAVEARKAAGTPILLYKTPEEVFAWHKAVAEGKAPPTPAWPENLDAGGLNYPWNPHWQVPGIMQWYEDPAQPGLRVYRVCFPGRTVSEYDAKRQESDRRRLYEATDQLRNVEMVLCVDCTGSMGEVFGAVHQAVRRIVEALRAEELSRADDLLKINLRLSIVGYRDLGDRPMIEETTRFFEVVKPDELRAFEGRLDRFRAHGGMIDGDPTEPAYEQPFEALRFVAEKLFNAEASRKGSAKAIVLLGDRGNHPKGYKGTALDVDDVIASLRQGRAAGLIPVYPVFLVRDPRHACDQWAAQMPKLAAETRGAPMTIVFNNHRADEEAVDKITATLREVVERQRAAIRGYIDSLKGAASGQFSPEPDAPDQPPAFRLAIQQLGDVMGEKEARAALARQAQSFFLQAYTSERHPAATPGGPPLFLPKNMFNIEEFDNIQHAARDLARGLEEILSKRDEFITAKAEDKFKDLVIRVMLGVAGDVDAGKIPPEVIDRWRAMSLDEIFSCAARLPVVFGCLKRGRIIGEADVHTLISELYKAANTLSAIRAENRRFFVAGFGGSDLHIWISNDELP